MPENTTQSPRPGLEPLIERTNHGATEPPTRLSNWVRDRILLWFQYVKWFSCVEEYSCGHLTVYILVGERDTNKRLLWICFSCHFNTTVRGNSALLDIRPCKNDVWRNSISNLIWFGGEWSKRYIQTLRRFFVDELIGVNIILKEAADCCRAHISR